VDVTGVPSGRRRHVADKQSNQTDWYFGGFHCGAGGSPRVVFRSL
jgi:hypothetical protein